MGLIKPVTSSAPGKAMDFAYELNGYPENITVPDPALKEMYIPKYSDKFMIIAKNVPGNPTYATFYSLEVHNLSSFKLKFVDVRGDMQEVENSYVRIEDLSTEYRIVFTMGYFEPFRDHYHVIYLKEVSA